MSCEWKPGDVAVVAGMRVLYTDGNEGPMFTFADGSRARADAVPADPARPLVVIDPEDREQVERLMGAFSDAWLANDYQAGKPPLRWKIMAAALREFANPTPPKPAEPTGLGAVVEDAKGERWIRAARIAHGWHRPMGTWAAYAEIDAVRVLSEGVTA